MNEVLAALILLMIIGAIVAIETSHLLYSVISLGAVGFLLSIVFLFLSAPDLAITQMAVEVITLVLLLRSTSAERGRRRHRDGAAGGGLRWSVLVNRLVPLLVVLLLAAFATSMFADFPRFGEPVMERFSDAPSNLYLQDGLNRTGAANIVTAVLLDFRAYDTLGEATILFCAVLGAISILRRRGMKHPDEPDTEQAR